MGRTADARRALAEALNPVLPGRVYPYPPSRPGPVTGPAVWVDTFTADWATDVVWSAKFRVRVVTDGAEHAAHALLDDLVDAVYDAVAASDELWPDSLAYETFDVDGTTLAHGYTFVVAVDQTTSSWCQPDPPTAVQIPAVPIGATTP